jgi:hypothetical protein
LELSLICTMKYGRQHSTYPFLAKQPIATFFVHLY